MSKVYCITPLEKKSIVYHVEMFRNNPDGTVSWFNLDETYRWGHGFIEADMDCNLPWEGDNVAYARADVGWGCEFDDSVNIEIEFSDGSVVQYSGVAEEVHRRFVNSPSPGSYYRDNIEENFTARRVRG